MSSFGGRMKEYERISLDRFDGKNLQSTVYFLSHLHEDHTVGLATPVFFKHLKTSKNVFLYCSDVTEVLIQASKKYRHLAPYIKKIGINSPTTIKIPDPLYDEVETVTVTFLPAFHCPGSVMCLFEGHEGTVLYTGDFRWEHFNIEQMYHLRSGESVKKVKSLYVDTTFCTPENLYIPSRQHCIDAVYQLVYEWISQSPQHVVYLSLRAQYGHEPLLNAVASRLNRKIHVAQHKVEVYNQIEEFHGNFTSDGSSTQIHACGREMQKVDGEFIPCRHTQDPDKVLGILPTTMYFTQFQHLTLDKIVRKVGDGFYRVCYSFHSSYTELKDLISYLKPENVYPNVKPPNDSSLAVVQYRLNTMLAECIASSNGAGDTEADTEVKQLGTLKTRSSKRTPAKRKPSTPSESDSLDFVTPTKLQKTDTQLQRQTRGRGRGVKSSQESEAEGTPVKGRGRGRGRQTKSSQEVAEEPQKRVSTRPRSKKVPDNETPQEKTPVKKQGTESPDIFLTPSKSEHGDVSKHSSYSGSHGDESEMDLTPSQKSLDLESSLEAKGDNIETWTGGSFLSAVSSHSGDEMKNCVCLVEDVEQTDENFEDVSQIEEEIGDEGGLTLEDVEEMETVGEITQATSSAKKTPARKGRKSRGKAASRSRRKQENDKSMSSAMSEKSSDNIQKCETDTVVINVNKQKSCENLEKSENIVTVGETEENETISKSEPYKEDITESRSAEALFIDQKQDTTVKQSRRQKGTKTVSEPVTKISKQENKNVSEPVTNTSKQESKTESEPNTSASKQESKTVSEPVTNTSKCESKMISEPVTNNSKQESKTISEKVTNTSKQENKTITESVTSTSKQENESVSQPVTNTPDQESKNRSNKDINSDSKSKAETAEAKSKQQLESKQVWQKSAERPHQASKENKSVEKETENKAVSVVRLKEVASRKKDCENKTNKDLKTAKENGTVTCILENDLSSNEKDSKTDSCVMQEKKTTETEAEQTKTCDEVTRISDAEAFPKTANVAIANASHFSGSESLKEAQLLKEQVAKPKKDESMPDKVIIEVTMKMDDTSEAATKTSDESGVKIADVANVGLMEGTADVVDDVCDEDLSNAIAESIGADLEFCEEEDVQAWKDDIFVTANDPLLKEDKYNDNADQLNDAESSISDDSDIIQDTPPNQMSVIENQLDKSVSSNIASDQKQFYTRHWPLTGSGTKQERRRKRKRKQRKKKYAALHGIIYYDSDCEIIIADEPKVEIDLTVGKTYDENDFEYDMRKKRKRARKISDTSNETLITVFKKEKLDDYHLYGGIKVHEEKKSVKKLKYTRRSSFEFGEENPEDTEFFAELEEALTKKGTSHSDTELESKLQPATDPLYEGLMEAEPLQTESAKYMEEADSKDNNEVNTDKENDSVELADKESKFKGSDENDRGNKLQKTEIENKIMVGNETVKVSETDKLKDSEESSKPLKASNIQYTETKEGKKLMRISLSSKKKTSKMPSQTYLGTEIFIDLSNEDDEVSENKSCPLSEKSESIIPSSSKHNDGDKSGSQIEVGTNMIPVREGVSKKSISGEQNISNNFSRVQENDEGGIMNTVTNSDCGKNKKETSNENEKHALGSEHFRSVTVLKFSKAEGKFTRQKVTDSEKYGNSEKTKMVAVQSDKNGNDLSETGIIDFKDTDSISVTFDDSQKSQLSVRALKYPEKVERHVADVQNAPDGKETNGFVKENVREDNKSKRYEVFEMNSLENNLEREKSFDAEIVETDDKLEDSSSKSNLIPELNEDEIYNADTTEKLEASVNKDIHIPGLNDDEIEIVDTNDKLGDGMNKDNYILGLNEKETDVLYVTDDEKSRGSTDSGEWLSCTKAREKQQQNIKKVKGHKKRLPKSDTQSKPKPQRLEKEPVKNVIDKYVKHISSAEKQKTTVPVLEGNKAKTVKHSQSTEFCQDVKKKQDKIKRKALEIMFGTDDENESECERTNNASPTHDIYDETISLSSDSGLDEELFTKNDSEMMNTSDPVSKPKPSVSESTTSTKIDRLSDSGSTAVEEDQQENQQNLPFGISSIVKSIDWAADISCVDTQEKDGPNITVVAHDSTQAQHGQSIEVVKHKKTKKKTKSKFETQTVSSFGSYSSGSFSSLQINVTQPNSPFLPGSRTVPPVVTTGPPPVLYPSTFYKVPPPVYNAPPPVYNVPPPNFNIPPPVNFIPQPNINCPPPPLPNASSVSNSFVEKTVTSQSILSSVPSSESSQTLFSSLRSQAASDSFLASLPGADPSQSLLSSVSLPSTVVGTLNKVLDVILNSKAAGVLDKETTITKSSADTKSVVTEVIDKVNKIQAARTSLGQSENRQADSGVISGDYGHRTSHCQDQRRKSDDLRQRYDEERDERGSLDDQRHRYDDLRERARADDQRYRPDDVIDERERADCRYRHDRMRDERERAEDLRYRRDDTRVHRDRVDDQRYRQDDMRERHTGRRYSHDDPRYDPDPRRYEDSERYRRRNSDRPFSPDDPYERERAREYDRERAWADYYRRVDEEDERRRYDYDRHYYEDDYDRGRRSRDPHYDYSPPRYNDRPHDPYYDDRRRHSRDSYDDYPPHDPYYDPPPRRYDDRYGDSQIRPHSRGSGPLSYHSDLDHQRSTSLSEQWDETRQPGNPRRPGKPRQPGKTPLVQGLRSKIPPLSDHQTKESSSLNTSKGSASASFPSVQSRNIPQQSQSYSQNSQPSSLQQGTSRLAQNAKLTQPSGPKTAILVSRGKRVGMASQQMMEKAQASISSKDFSPGDTNTDNIDSSRPAFCTGLSQESSQKTGYTYRKNAVREKIKSLLNEAD